MRAVAWRALKRLGWMAVVVLGVLTLSFGLLRALPGDPARLLVGPQASSRDVERARVLYGLDQPLWSQYGRYLARVVHRGADPIDRRKDPDHRACVPLAAGLHMDLGYSFYYRKPVAELLDDRAARSFQLAGAALLLQLLLGTSLGALAATRRGGRVDELTTGAALLAASAPTFITGLGLQYLLAHRLGWLPLDGYGATDAEHAASLVLPALTLGVAGTATYLRLAREEVAGLLAQDFVRAARARGASPARVLLVHVLRSALVPLSTLAVLDLGTLVGGAVVTESLFRWPGIGELAVQGLQNQEGPVVMGVVLYTATILAIASAVVDVAGAVLDPRLRR